MMGGIPQEHGEKIADYATYPAAQQAVSQLIQADIPARDIQVVGHGLRSIETVTGKLGYAAAARSGAPANRTVGSRVPGRAKKNCSGGGAGSAVAASTAAGKAAGAAGASSPAKSPSTGSAMPSAGAPVAGAASCGKVEGLPAAGEVAAEPNAVDLRTDVLAELGHGDRRGVVGDRRRL